MSNTSTQRVLMIAEDLADQGFYTRASTIASLAKERDALLDKVEKLTRDKHAMALSPNVPAGHDTILGYLASYHPEILDAMDYTNPEATKRDGWWLMHQCTKHNVRVVYADAPPVLRACGITRVRCYPIELLARRFG